MNRESQIIQVLADIVKEVVEGQIAKHCGEQPHPAGSWVENRIHAALEDHLAKDHNSPGSLTPTRDQAVREAVLVRDCIAAERWPIVQPPHPEWRINWGMVVAEVLFHAEHQVWASFFESRQTRADNRSEIEAMCNAAMLAAGLTPPSPGE